MVDIFMQKQILPAKKLDICVYFFKNLVSRKTFLLYHHSF